MQEIRNFLWCVFPVVANSNRLRPLANEFHLLLINSSQFCYSVIHSLFILTSNQLVLSLVVQVTEPIAKPFVFKFSHLFLFKRHCIKAYSVLLPCTVDPRLKSTICSGRSSRTLTNFITAMNERNNNGVAQTLQES